MDLLLWKKENDKLFAKAIDTMADYAIEQFVDSDDLVNATDLNECDADDIQYFYDILYNTWFEPEEGKSFSIKEIIKSNRGSRHSVFEDYAEENWEEFLDDDLIEAIYDRINVGKIVGKYCYGGGGFEVERDFELAVKDKVAEKIKEKFRKNNK